VRRRGWMLFPGLALASALLLAPGGCAKPGVNRPLSPRVSLPEPRELDAPRVRFLVRTLPVDGTLYLAGSFNRWSPADPAFAFERTVETASGVLWTLELERDRLGSPPIEFQFTRGSWARVETDGASKEFPRRRIDAAELARWPERALLVLDFRVNGFLDQR
jgi:hypothetical protein